MFDGKYLDWNTKRIKTIINNYGYTFFHNKKVLDLGSGHGDVGASLYRLGAEVTCVDAREEHLKVASKKFPGIKTFKADLDRPWPFQNKTYDVILDLDLVCHLKDFEKHINEVCKSTDFLILETAVSDSDDPNFAPILNENKLIYDWSFNGFSAFPSAAAIEALLLSNGMIFKRVDSKSLNSGVYSYDWIISNSKECSYNKRRMWFAEKAISTPKPISHKSVGIISNIDRTPERIMQRTEVQFNTQNKSHIEFPYKPNNSPDKLRAALCLSGYMRTFEINYSGLWNYLLNELNCDVFIHTWDTLGSNKNVLDNRVSNFKTSTFETKLNNFYSPKKMVIEPPKSFLATPLMHQKNDGRDLNNVLSMYYKVKACNDLKAQYEQENNFKYDCVIRCRPDLHFSGPVNIKKGIDLNILYIPKYGDFGGYNDQFAFSNSSIMDTYSSLYDKIEEHLKNGALFNPEKLLKFHIDHNNISVTRPEIKYHILRPTGNIQDNFELEVRTGHLPRHTVHHLQPSHGYSFGPPPSHSMKYGDVKDIKVAVCISGHLRTFEQTYKSFLANIMHPFKNFDVFMHTWETMGSAGGIAADDHIANIKTYTKLKEINSLINPTVLEIENYDVYNTELEELDKRAILTPSERVGFRSGNLKSYGSMLYSWNKNRIMLESYEKQHNIKYDLIIKIRLDESFTQSINLNNFYSNRIYVPDVAQFYDGAMNDQFAIGDNHSMKIYLDLYNKLLSYLNNKEPYMLRPEVILKHHLRKNSIYVVETQIPYHLVRADGSVWHLPKTRQTR